MKTIIKLEKEFKGVGEVSKLPFLQLNSSKTAYIYQVGYKDVYYEIFVKKTVPMCIDFEKRIYSETEFKEIYPKAKDFGIWAWTYNNYLDAINKMQEL